MLAIFVRLHLHVGHGKTGSSFLQSWLSINATALQERMGLLYPDRCPISGRLDRRAQQSQFSMGNGYVLQPLLDPSCGLFRAKRWRRRLFRQHGVDDQALKGVVFSYEPWARHLPSQLNHLLSKSELLGFEGLDLWLLVRDPLDHAVSVYGQMVKRHGFAGGLDDWLEIYDFPNALLHFLKTIRSCDGSLSLAVDHYGRNKHSLINLLKDWLSLSAGYNYSDPKKVVNRSLTLQELCLVRHLNARDPALGLAVGELLVDRLPSIRQDCMIPSMAAQQRFISRWSTTIEIINSLLPENASLGLVELTGSCDKAVPSGASTITLSCEQLDSVVDALIASRQNVS